MDGQRIVVVGAGQAGAAVAGKLRALGFGGSLTLVGAEPVPPYQRPPLSKKYLTGEMARERLFLRPEAFYAEQGIELRLGREVTAIDRAARVVRLGQEALPWDRLVLATGAAPRRLPAAQGGDLPGVHVMRSLADADAMAPAFRPGARVVIVGGGYIGLEAAAVAAARGLRVTVVEAAPRILARVACAETADWFRDLHRGHGVEILEGVGVERLTGEARVTGVALADGRHIACDFAILGIGVVPGVALAGAAGLEIADGIAVDALGRTSDPDIWAAGDCASFPHGAGRLRLESVQNAIDQAEAVAANLMGAGAPYVPMPWFWSDQYDAKLQIAGLGTGADRIVVRQAEGRSHWYFAGERLLAVDAMNDARAYMVGKRLLEAGRSPDPARLADPATALRDLLAG
ncbi:MAG: NAD(P)/FAD-dependent oxidoreductase [Alkalilacustris sp.]